MKKYIIASLLVIVAIGVFSSCNNSKTYAQRLNDEKKVIERFIDINDIKILHEYPKDSVFQSNEFYLDPSSGVYYNVINSGTSRKILNGENFSIRFKGLKYISDKDSTIYSNIYNKQPEVLTFGNPSTYKSAAWVVPLKNVGYSAKVKMIVPFKMGLSNDIQMYKSAYYEEIEYKLWEGVTVVK